jgi:hypothetical protein
MAHFEIDRDVERVLTFMQDNLPAFKRVAIAHSVAQISDLLWERHKTPIPEVAKVQPFALITRDNDFIPASRTCSSEPRLDATEHLPLHPPVSSNPTHEERSGPL